MRNLNGSIILQLSFVSLCYLFVCRQLMGFDSCYPSV